MAPIHVARSGLVSLIDGERVRVHAGDTVEEGHPLLAASPESFKPFEVTFPAPKPAKRAQQ